MAKKIQHVWGLEIGQSALKGLRCHLEGDQVVTDVFDFVEYPKILSQPEAEPELLIADAMQQFLSRNDLRGAKVGVSVPGQSGLAKFFKPPPVEVKKIGDIVKYEAKQQIPFDLNDVIWDYQQMEGAQIEDGYALESEVGLFAMKRDAVFRSLKPYRESSMDLDLVQLAPMSIYNMIAHDRFAERMANEPFDPESPQKSTVVLSIGTDASDLIVTNGFRVWQRSIPIGGNHFTRQLTKDLKLTFAKAEHLKRNAMQADDPKLVFQAMRPVFNDMVTEIQRSLNFFKTLNKKSELEAMLLLGNTAKLPGLQQFLNKNLGMDVDVLDKFPKLEGTEVTGAQAFKENSAAFGVVYGICLQLLNRGPMKTSLLPREIVIDRVVRMKKPWVVGALSLLLVGMVTNHALMGRVLSVVAEPRWDGAQKVVARVSSESDNEKKIDSDKTGAIALLSKVGNEVGVGAKKRVMVLELHKAIEASLNRDPTLANKTAVELPYPKRKDFHITRVEQKFETDLTRWFSAQLLESYKAGVATRRQLLKAANEGEEVPDPSPLVGGGWVVELKGYHYFNGSTGEEGEAHVLKYLVEFLEKGGVELPDDEGSKQVMMSMTGLGIRLPVVIQSNIDGNYRVSNPAHLKRMIELGMAQPMASGSTEGGTSSSASTSSSKGKGGSMGMGMGMGMSGPGGPGGPGIGEGSSGASGGGPAGQPTGKPITDADGKTIPASFPAPRCDFVLQFAWQPRFDPEGGEKAGGLLPKPPEPESTGTEAGQDPAATSAESAG
ncbi:MAG: pilus assembly protein PilM [Planctomycetota bacterium]|nr:pilus assembly protein PilM [Planctomycetota bacterium]